ncbi:hypothetical protein CASFOL_016835 [Castilleja foliolosa]|uniref:Uncharacterized protein n=1 Tax=Castilleja foliolosa TaxID=1961234 RepID=A0ABD3D9V5_9LAMI
MDGFSQWRLDGHRGCELGRQTEKATVGIMLVDFRWGFMVVTVDARGRSEDLEGLCLLPERARETADRAFPGKRVVGVACRE